MGQEAMCTVRYGKQRSAGKALLETNEIIFRGDFRLKIPLLAITSVKATNGELHVQTADTLAVFDLGDKAEKWLAKILHPKSRLEKLGVKPKTGVALVGTFDSEFLRELNKQTKNVSTGKVVGDTECIFFAAESRTDLTQIRKITKAMKAAMALWIVYPKGQKALTENDVLSAGRAAGLKDMKVVGFSPTHTALKFVLPLSSR